MGLDSNPERFRKNPKGSVDSRAYKQASEACCPATALRDRPGRPRHKGAAAIRP